MQEAGSKYSMAAAMIQARFRPRVCLRVLFEAMHERNIWFHKLREKPILTDEDVAARYAWAQKYRNKSAEWWRQAVHIHTGNHAFKVPTNAAARRALAATRVYGTYRSPGKSLRKEHVKAKKQMRLSTGARGVLVAGGVGGGKVLLWHVVEP